MANTRKKDKSKIIDGTVHEPDVEDIGHENKDDDLVLTPMPTMAVKILKDEDVEKEVARLSHFETYATSLKEKYGNLEIKGVGDKEGYDKVRTAIADLRILRQTVEKNRKEVKQPFIDAGKKIDKRAEDIASITETLEKELTEKRRAIDSETERIRAEKKAKEEKRWFERLEELVKMGVTQIEGNLVLGDISYKIVTVRESDDDIYQDDILGDFKKIYQKKLDDLAEQKKMDEEEAERVKKQQAELKKQQDDLAEQKRKLEEQQAEFKKQQEKDAEEKRLAAEKIRMENEEKARKLSRERGKILEDLGMKYSFINESYTYPELDVAVNLENLKTWTVEDFQNQVDTVSPKIEEAKTIAANKAAEQKKADDAELLRKAEEKRKKDEQDAADLKAEELRKSGDKKQWEHFISQVNALVIPTVQSGQYKNKVNNAKLLLEQLKKV